jgi:hypothetical protein
MLYLTACGLPAELQSTITAVVVTSTALVWTPTPTLTQTPISTPTHVPAHLPTLTQSITPTITNSPTVTTSPTLGIGSKMVSLIDGMVMVYVPAGEFQMGCDLNHNGGFPCPPHELLHTVYL